MTSGHTDKRFDEDLGRLKEAILKTGTLVEEMIASSMQSLVARDADRIKDVIEQEKEVNRMELEIDDLCHRLLALHQPAASDLRFIMIGLRASKDLERIGDLAVNVADQAKEVNREAPLKPYVDLPRMAEKSQKMVKDALDAFVKKDSKLAQGVCLMDDEVDTLNDKLYEELVSIMAHNPGAVTRGVRLILVARHLERIADHATNVAEEVIFMVEGRDIRHRRGTPNRV